MVTLLELTFLKKGGPDVSYFYLLSTLIFTPQYKFLCREEIISANLTLCCMFHVCTVYSWIHSGKRVAIWSVANSSSPPNIVYLFKFTFFWLSCSWLSTGIDVSKISWSLIRRPLVSLCVSHPARHKENLQVDTDISLKNGRILCLGLSWVILETVLLGESINDS